MNSKLIVNLARTAVLVVLMALYSMTSSASYVDKVLVIVNDDVITQSELNYRLNAIKQELVNQKQAVPEGLAKQVLDGLVTDRLQTQEAEFRGISISDDEIDASIALFAKERNLTVEQVKKTNLKSGLSFETFKKNVRDSLLLSRLNEYYTQIRVVVPDYEIDGFIAQNNLTQSDIEYQIAHILINDPENNRAKADKALIELEAGETFNEVAARYSDASDSKEGGVIGWRKLEQLPEIFSDAIKKMNTGSVSGVLTSPNGLHILKLLDQKGKMSEITQTKLQHILIAAKGNVAVAQAKKRALELRQRALTGEDFSGLARIYSDDSVSAASGGDLGWVSPKDMVPAFEQAFDQLKLNELSLPVATSYGVHLIKVLDRRQQNISDKLVRTKVENILRRQRSGREYTQWLRRLKEKAYIEYIDSV